MTDEILTLPEVAQLLKVAEKTVYTIAQKGELPAFKVGGNVTTKNRRHRGLRSSVGASLDHDASIRNTMSDNVGIHTERLLLRRWRPSDRAAFSDICADAEVMRHFPATLTREQSDAFVDRIEAHFRDHGWGQWAVERRDTGGFLGFVGLGIVSYEAHFTPAVEVGWRLARRAWGQGFATEAARAALRYAFDVIGLDEVVSLTVLANERSWRVMERLGMTRDPADDFDHPNLAVGHPLRRHVLYRIRRP